jgi:hypothetical protein
MTTFWVGAFCIAFVTLTAVMSVWLVVALEHRGDEP